MKKNKFFRFLSLLLCVSLLLTMNYTTAWALEPPMTMTGDDTVVEMTMGNPIHTWTVTDREEDFPLNIQPIIDYSSVEYRPVPVGDVPIEDMITVNVSELQVGLNISLKDSANIQGNYRLIICKDNETVLNGVYDSDDVVMVDALVYNESYSISVETETEDSYIEYVGDFYYGVDAGNEVFYSMQYKTFEQPKTASQSSVAPNCEEEPNDTADNATIIVDAGSWCGSIYDVDESDGVVTDVDWFQWYDIDYQQGSDQKHIFVYVKNYSEYSLSYSVRYYNVLEESWSTIESRAVPANGVLAVRYDMSEYNLGSLYVRFSSLYECDYKFSIDAAEVPVWYSQKAGKIGSYTYWNTEKLDRTIFPKAANGNTTTARLFVNNSDNTFDDDYGYTLLGEWGCGIASAAMILRNLGCSTIQTYRDFRLDVSGHLGADPYTVFLANNELPSPSYTYNGSNYTFSDNSKTVSVSTNWARISAAFGSSTSSSTWFGTDNAQAIRNSIAAQLDNHPEGIVLRLNRDDGTGHFLVATGYTTTNGVVTNIIVCDPYTANASKGNNVLITDSYSFTRASRAYTWSQIDWYLYFN